MNERQPQPNRDWCEAAWSAFIRSSQNDHQEEEREHDFRRQTGHQSVAARRVRIEAVAGETVLDAALRHGIDIEHACEKSCACTTCHIVVREGFASLEPSDELEDDMLDKAWGLEPQSRLSCQAQVADKDLVVENKMHVIWWSFATIYQDGSWDAGSFMVGHDNLGYAIFQNEKGEVRCTTSIEGEVVHKPGSYFVESARIVLEGDEVWEFLPDPKGEMRDFVGGFPITAQQEGRWRRVGDTREPDHWFGWGESDRRNGAARNVRGSDL